MPFVIPAAVSVLFLKERLTILNWIGIALAVFAIAVLGLV